MAGDLRQPWEIAIDQMNKSLDLLRTEISRNGDKIEKQVSGNNEKVEKEISELRNQIGKDVRELRVDLKNYGEKLAGLSGEQGGSSTLTKVLTSLVILLLATAIGGGIWSGSTNVSLTSTVASNTTKLEGFRTTLNQLPANLGKTVESHAKTLKEVETGLQKSKDDLQHVATSIEVSSNIVEANKAQIESLTSANLELNKVVSKLESKLKDLGDLKSLPTKINTTAAKAEKAVSLAEQGVKNSKEAIEKTLTNAQLIEGIAKELASTRDLNTVTARFLLDARSVLAEEGATVKFSLRLVSASVLEKSSVVRVNAQVDGFYDEKATQIPGYPITCHASMGEKNVALISVACAPDAYESFSAFLKNGGQLAGNLTVLHKVAREE